MLLVTHFINIFRSSWKKTLVLKTPWFSKLRGSQNLASLQVESKTTSYTQKGTLCFFPKTAQVCTQTVEEYLETRDPMHGQMRGREKETTLSPQKLLFSLSLTRFAKQRSGYIDSC